MKYMIEYSFRTGDEYTSNIENGETLTRAFGKWKPEEGLNVLAFLASLSDTGGYVLVDAADPKTVFSFVSKFSPWARANVDPVIDVTESVPLGSASLAWARSNSKA